MLDSLCHFRKHRAVLSWTQVPELISKSLATFETSEKNGKLVTRVYTGQKERGEELSHL